MRQLTLLQNHLSSALADNSLACWRKSVWVQQQAIRALNQKSQTKTCPATQKETHEMGHFGLV